MLLQDLKEGAVASIPESEKHEDGYSDGDGADDGQKEGRLEEGRYEEEQLPVEQQLAVHSLRSILTNSHTVFLNSFDPTLSRISHFPFEKTAPFSLICGKPGSRLPPNAIDIFL